MEVKSLCTQWKRYIWEVGTLLCDVYEAREWATGLQLWRYCTGGKVWQPMWLCWQGDLVQTQPNDVTPFPQSAHSGTPLHVALNWHSHCAPLSGQHTSMWTTLHLYSCSVSYTFDSHFTFYTAIQSNSLFVLSIHSQSHTPPRTFFLSQVPFLNHSQSVTHKGIFS